MCAVRGIHSLTDIVGGATLECPSMKIRSQIGSLKDFRPYGIHILIIQLCNVEGCGN